MSTLRDDTLRTLLDQTVVGVYVIDLTGTIVHMSTRFGELCGWSREAMIGRPYFDFLAGGELRERKAVFARLTRGEIEETRTVGTFRGQDGRTREILTQSRLSTFEGNQVVAGIAVDITDQLLATVAMKRSDKALRTLIAASTALIRATSESELFQEMCRLIVEGTTYSVAWIGSPLDNEEKTVVALAQAGGDLIRLGPTRVRLNDPVYGSGPTGVTLRTGRTTLAQDLGADSTLDPWRADFDRIGVKSALSIPLTDESGCFAALTLYAFEAFAFDDDEIRLLTQLGSDISYGVRALRNRTALREEEERSRAQAERLEALWRIINNPSLRDDELLHAMLEQGSAAIRPGQPFLGVLSRIDGEDMVYEAAAGTPEYIALRGAAELLPARHLPIAGSAAESILADGKTVSVDDIGAAFPSSPLLSMKMTTGIFTPFRAGGTTYLLWFVSPAFAEPWSQLDHGYVEVLASFFAKNVQERWNADRLLYHQTHDVLTGLLNRSHFRSQARMASLAETTYAVVTLDVNGFGEVNETYGSMIGDALLVEVAAGLQERAANGEIVGRLGGDVFAVYIPSPRSQNYVSERALHFSERFRKPFSTGDRDGKEFISLATSVGIALAPEHGESVDVVVSHASIAARVASAQGRGKTLFYEPGMEGDALRNTLFHTELATAIAGDQLVLYYQPHLDLATGAVEGCEALVRWNHPTRGLLMPGQFIPFAERNGLIADIDAWVMHAALVTARELGALRPGFRLYFNLSGRQAGDPGLIDALKRAAGDGLVLQNVGIEITETDAMRDVESTRAVCVALRELGVRIAIDDFGTGYSSLSSLKNLPIDVLKIDRSFIMGVLTDRYDAAIVETIIGMGKLFECDVLAEGVEEQAELDWLKERSCDTIQGYLLSRAIPLEDFKAFLERE